MKKDQVPQHSSRTYAGNRKLMYAVDDDGSYTSVTSSGWEVEENATTAAIEDYEAQARIAWQAARKGECSPLAYHMYKHRMDLPLLAQVTGFFQWRIRRHFRPAVFRRLSDKKLQRYSDALGIPRNQLLQLPLAP